MQGPMSTQKIAGAAMMKISPVSETLAQTISPGSGNLDVKTLLPLGEKAGSSE